MIKSLFKSRSRKASTRRQMQVEGLEARALLTIGTPTFVPIGGTLYLQFDGTANRDAFLLTDTPQGDVIYQAWEDAEGDGFDDWNLEQDGTVSAGEIALARVLNGNIPYGGVRVLAGGENDIVDGYVDSVLYTSPNGSVVIPSGLGLISSPADYPIWAEGEGGNDQLQGGRKRDSLLGGSGNDQVFADRFDNPDSLRGGTGNDTLLDSALGTPGGVGISVLNYDFENVLLDNNARDRVDNRVFSDTSTDSKGVVTVLVRTFGGDDTIISGPNTIGASTLQESLDGGAGIDTISYEGYSTSVEVNLALQTVVGANDTITAFENATGGSANDILIGSALANVLIGGDGDDTIEGRAGNDSFVGGEGNDNLSGGGDNDTVSGGNGADLMDGGAGNDSMLGGSGSDTMTGGNGGDYMLGGTDAVGTFFDEVYGQGGNDSIVIPWDYVSPYLAMPMFPAPGAYYGGPGVNTFLIGNTPVGVSSADFTNAFDNFVLWLQFNNLTDWGSPNIVVRSTTLV